MPTCNNCGQEIKEGKKFCSNCGAPVPTAKKCPNCGTECKPGVKFCPECGTKLQAEPVPTADDQPIEQPQPAPDTPEQTPPTNQPLPGNPIPPAGKASQGQEAGPVPPPPNSFQAAAAAYQNSPYDFQRQAKRAYLYYKLTIFFDSSLALYLGIFLLRNILQPNLFNPVSLVLYVILALALPFGLRMLFKYLRNQITHPENGKFWSEESETSDGEMFQKLYHAETKQTIMVVIGLGVGVIFFLLGKSWGMETWPAVLFGAIFGVGMYEILIAFWALKWVAIILSVVLVIIVASIAASHPFYSLLFLSAAFDSGEENPTASYTQQTEAPDVEILNTAVVYDEEGNPCLTVNVKWVNNTGVTATPNDTFDITVIQNGETLLPNFSFSGYSGWDMKVSPGGSYLCSGQFYLNNDYDGVEVQITNPYGLETYLAKTYYL